MRKRREKWLTIACCLILSLSLIACQNQREVTKEEVIARFLDALRNDDVAAFSELVEGDYFVFTYVYTYGRLWLSKGESILYDEIYLADLDTLDIRPGTTRVETLLTQWFSDVPPKEYPVFEISEEDYNMTSDLGDIVWRYSAVLGKVTDFKTGFTILETEAGDFIFVHLSMAAMTFSSWAYFRKARNDYKLESIVLFR
jgi:hypothetical protein